MDIICCVFLRFDDLVDSIESMMYFLVSVFVDEN